MSVTILTTITPRHAQPVTTMPDPMQALIAAARRAATAHGCPVHEKLIVAIKLPSGEKILQMLAYPQAEAVSAEARGMPVLSAKQKKILCALLPGAMKGDTLAEACELGAASSLHSGRGLRQLTEAGLVINDERDGYTLTEFGEDVANEINEG